MASPLSRLLRRPSALRHAASSSPSPSSFSSPASFAARPGPPKLPAAQQAEFERLQRAVAESPPPPQSPPAAAAAPDPVPDPVPRAAPPEFAGDVNPATGEVGGPKNEPLRWGAAGDWSYNGRVTDF